MKSKINIITLFVLIILFSVVLFFIQDQKNALNDSLIDFENENFRLSVVYIRTELQRAIKIYDNSDITDQGKTYYLNTMRDGIELALRYTPNNFHNEMRALEYFYFRDYDENTYNVIKSLSNEINERYLEFEEDYLIQKEIRNTDFNELFKEYFTNSIFLSKLNEIMDQ